MPQSTSRPKIASACPLGYTRAQIEEIMGDQLAAFDKWMYGQTQSVCDGRWYDHGTKSYQPSMCADTPHGVVTYEVDVSAFLRGWKPLD